VDVAQERVIAALGGRADALKEPGSERRGTEVGDEGQAPDHTREGEEIVRAFKAAKRDNPLLGAAAVAELAIKGISNKNAMKYVREKAVAGVTFLAPEDEPQPIPHAEAIKAYVLGPPRDEALLLDLNPKGNEKFHLAPSGSSLALGEEGRAFAMAAAPEMLDNGGAVTFASRYRINAKTVFDHDPNVPIAPKNKDALDYLRTAYGAEDPNCDEASGWRRIDDEWLGVSEGLALRLNNEVNNTSLVLAIELPKTGKVILFTGDAQRGSWLGWADLKWVKDDGTPVTTRDLLSRCILYKVGHHGSHNATLNGTDHDDYANIGWMARGTFADQFVAMIPANTQWAMGKKKPWRHPLPEIEEALHKKARGRVFRTDRDKIEQPDPSVLSQEEWDDFKKLVKEEKLFFEFTIRDN